MLTLDYFILELLVDELAPQLARTRIAKVHQPSVDCLIFKLWNGRRNLKLLIQVGRGARLHLTEQNFANPFQPPRFCQLLRARLKKLESISMLGHERVVELSFKGTDQQYRLVCELIGERSNLYLLDEAGLLVDGLLKPQDIGNRHLQRGKPYQALPRQSLLDLSRPEVTVPEEIKDQDGFENWLCRCVAPMSKGQARQLKVAAELSGDIPSTFMKFKRDWSIKNSCVSLLEERGTKQLIAYPADSQEVLAAVEDDLSQFMDQCFSPQKTETGEVGERSRLRQVMTRQLVRLNKRLKNISTQQIKTSSHSDRRQQGELLLANLHRVKRGMSEVEVTDWTCDPPQQTIINLQKDLSPQENAERLFKRYKKEKRGIEHVSRRLRETAEEIQWLESLQLALDEAVETSDLVEIGQELLAAGLTSTVKGEPANRHKTKSTPALHECRSPSGLRIFWGRNNRSNDYLSARLTDQGDLWFHAHNMPGCHLVLKRDGLKGDFSPEDIDFAARIAAGYSRGKNAARVEVIVSEGQHINRPKGARPGLVTLGTYRTLLVEPLRILDNEK